MVKNCGCSPGCRNVGRLRTGHDESWHEPAICQDKSANSDDSATFHEELQVAARVCREAIQHYLREDQWIIAEEAIRNAMRTYFGDQV